MLTKLKESELRKVDARLNGMGYGTENDTSVIQWLTDRLFECSGVSRTDDLVDECNVEGTVIAESRGPLQAVIEAYLEAVGFTSYIWQPEGQPPTKLWGHLSLGQGRMFHDALAWALGCESEGHDLRAEARTAIGLCSSE